MARFAFVSNVTGQHTQQSWQVNKLLCNTQNTTQKTNK
uniref:Uncharacterized protein n=1 Tax=Anguilla anguilla TaxID=7936 RepID=A0A0E9T406_ANGAN